MDVILSTIVVFYSPGSFVDETQSKVVTSRDIDSLVIPKYAFGFEFYDQVTAQVTLDDGTVVELESDAIRISPMHYIGARVMTLEEVKAETPDAHSLISNMEGNDHTEVIKTRCGTYRYLREGDIHIPEAVSQS